MKKILMVTACILSTVIAASAQSQYDAARFMGSELNGTARFVGMGGAMGALGGDISVMGTNPAGIGIYRSNDIAFSFGFNNTAAESNFNGSVVKDNRTRASFDQIGFVYSNKIGNTTSVRYVNFGFNYQKRKNFNNAFSMGGNLDGFSQTWQMATMLNDLTNFGEGDFNALWDAANPYTSPDWYGVPYLSAMGVRTGLVTYDEKATPRMQGFYGANNNYYSREEGGINQYDFNVAFNIEDRIYLGATLGVYDVNYTRYSSYIENLLDDKGGDNGYYNLENWMNTEGTGVDLKLGVIARPFENSPFRIGFAVHTPIWYNLTDTYTANLYSDVLTEKAPINENLSEYLKPDYVWDYQLTTPWKFNVNMGTTLGGLVAVGAEYEYEDYSAAKLKDSDGMELNGTNAIKETLKGIHTLRFGLEARVVPQFSIRAGYNYQTAAFVNDSFKNIVDDETRPDSEYNNTKSKNTFTFGLGYRGSVIYADLAYKYDIYKSDFYAFEDFRSGSNGLEYLPSTKVDNSRHQLLLTVGARF